MLILKPPLAFFKSFCLKKSYVLAHCPQLFFKNSYPFVSLKTFCVNSCKLAISLLSLQKADCRQTLKWCYLHDLDSLLKLLVFVTLLAVTPQNPAKIYQVEHSICFSLEHLCIYLNSQDLIMFPLGIALLTFHCLPQKLSTL